MLRGRWRWSAAMVMLLPMANAADTSAQVSTRGDTTVRMASRPVHAGVARLVEELTIGVLDGAEEYVFGDIVEVAAGPDGSIYVFDRQVPALRKYDARGRYVATLGRGGRGPGEYVSGGGLAVAPDGRVLLWDTGTWRINVYSPAGESLGSFPTPSGFSGTMVTSRALVVDTAGNACYRIMRGMLQQRGQSGTLWIRIGPDGVVRDTLVQPDLPPQPRVLTASTANAAITMPVPFAPSRTWRLSPLGYFVTGLPSRYAFELLPPPRTAAGRGAGAAWRPGDPVVSVRRDARPARVSRQERDSARDAVEQRMRRTAPGWNWNGPDMPDVKPAYEDLHVGDDGRIWVALVREAPRPGGSVSFGGGAGGRGVVPPGMRPARPGTEEKPRPALWDVWEPDGTYLGQVEVAPRVWTVARRGDHVWGVAYDEDDVAYIKRFRITWPRPPSPSPRPGPSPKAKA